MFVIPSRGRLVVDSVGVTRIADREGFSFVESNLDGCGSVGSEMAFKAKGDFLYLDICEKGRCRESISFLQLIIDNRAWTGKAKLIDYTLRSHACEELALRSLI